MTVVRRTTCVDIDLRYYCTREIQASFASAMRPCSNPASESEKFQQVGQWTLGPDLRYEVLELH